MIKLRAADARARQEWVDKLRAVAEIYTRAIANSHPPLPPREQSLRIGTNVSSNINAAKTPVVKLEILDAFANCREQLNKAEKQNINLNQVIELSDLNLDPELLLLKATSYAMICTLGQCLNILYQ